MSVKKLLLISAATGLALAGSSVALAGGPDHMGGCPYMHNILDGLYVGGGITSNLGYAKTRVTTFVDDMSVNGWGGRLQLGYGSFVKGNFYVGGEANLEATDAKTGNHTSTQVWGVEDKWNYGFSFVPGYRLMPNVLVYGKIGYERADVDTENSSGNSNTQGFNGMVWGAGLAGAIRSNMDLRLEYNYYQLGKETTTINGVNGDVTPRFSVVALTLNYHVPV